MRRRPNDVLNALYSDLERLKDKHDKLVTAKELETARQQVLLESIQAHEQVSAFKRDMEQQLQDALEDAYLPQAPSTNSNHKPAPHAPPNYVMSLLQTVTPELVQQVWSWQADDWHRFLTEAASTVSLLVQLTSRNGSSNSHEATTAAASQQPHHELLAEQQLCEAVDHIVTVGALGGVYGEITGPQLGICTATNHITGVQEAPPQQHWQNVLQQLQLSRPQLLKLSACFNEFTRQRKAQSQFQAMVASASACNNSCSLQLLAAGPRGLVMRPGSAPPDMGGAEAAEGSAATAADAGPQPGTHGAASPVSASAAAGAGAAASSGGYYAQSEGAAAACSSTECSAPDPSHLMAHLLCMVNRSFIMAFMTLHNTLTRQQVAKMLVASFPYVPRAGPLMEAASQVLLQGAASIDQRLTPDAEEEGEVDGEQGDGEDSDD